MANQNVLKLIVEALERVFNLAYANLVVLTSYDCSVNELY
jgi:hypothetical protein